MIAFICSDVFWWFICNWFNLKFTCDLFWYEKFSHLNSIFIRWNYLHSKLMFHHETFISMQSTCMECSSAKIQMSMNNSSTFFDIIHFLIEWQTEWNIPQYHINVTETDLSLIDEVFKKPAGWKMHKILHIIMNSVMMPGGLLLINVYNSWKFNQLRLASTLRVKLVE